MSERVGAIEREHAGGLAFFAVRNGPGYQHQFERQGFGDELAAMQSAWSEGDHGAATEIAAGIAGRFGRRGSIGECIEQIEAQERAGVDLHQAAVASEDDDVWADALSRLVGSG